MQHSPLQPAHLRLCSQPESRGRQSCATPRLPASVLGDAGVSQIVSSQHSLKGHNSQAAPGIPNAGRPIAGSMLESPHAALVQRASQQSGQRAGHTEAGEERSEAERGHDRQMKLSQGPAEQQQTQQPWKEAVELLHSLVCQISEREGTVLLTSQCSQPCETLPQHGQHVQLSAAVVAPQDRSHQQPPALAHSQPEPSSPQQRAQKGSLQGLDEASAPQGGSQVLPQKDRAPGKEPLPHYGGVSQGAQLESQEGTPSQAKASSSSTTSHGEAKEGQHHASAGAGSLARVSRLSQTSLSQRPDSLSAQDNMLPSDASGNRLTPSGDQYVSQHHTSPAWLPQNGAERSSGKQTTSDLSIDVGGPEDIPDFRPHSTAPCRREEEGLHALVSAPKVSTQGQPAQQGELQASQHFSQPASQQSKPPAGCNADSTSADDGGQAARGTQDTEVEGGDAGAGQEDVKLCLQLSSEDQDMDCGQQLFPSLQPPGELSPPP